MSYSEFRGLCIEQSLLSVAEIKQFMLPPTTDIDSIIQSLIRKIDKSANLQSFWEDTSIKTF